MRRGLQVAINTVGPFQNADYRVAKACIDAGVHYIDLADSYAFVTGITRLDAAARARGVAIISGASTVPALSGAVVAEAGLTPLSVRIGISPGNRAPRGASLVEAVMEQAGKPLPVLRDGTWTKVPGWSLLHRRSFRIDRDLSLGKRWLSACDAPDLVLLPRLYPTLNTVEFHAGLELAFLHLGLWMLSVLVRLGLVKSLLPLAVPLRWIGDRLRSLGSDRGGMLVDVDGMNEAGARASYRWRLIADDGDGPFVPAAPSVALVRRLARGQTLTPGAYPCLGILSVPEILSVVAHLAIHTADRTKERHDLFALALQVVFGALPDPIRAIHQRSRCFSASGRCDVDHGSSPLAHLVGALVRLPRAGRNVPLTVRFIARGRTESWERNFGGRIMRSHLRRAEIPGHVIERFGSFAFTIRLRWDGACLHYEIAGGRFLGLRLPRAMLPRSEAFESVEDGVFRFDVRLSLPVVGLLAHYRGWLKPDAMISDAVISGAAGDRG